MNFCHSVYVHNDYHFYLSDDGEGSFDDDFDKIGNSVSAFTWIALGLCFSFSFNIL